MNSDGKEIQSGALKPIACAPGKSCEVKIPVEKIRGPEPGKEYWLRVSFQTETDSLWAKAGHEIAWQQLPLEAVGSRGRSSHPLIGNEELKLLQDGDAVRISGANCSVAFSRAMGTLTSLNFAGQEILATNDLAGPVLQLFRAPTDNDKGFGKWLARDWREAGLTNLTREMDSFEVRQPHPSEVQIITTATSHAANGGYKMKTLWTVRGDGSLEMANEFRPFGSLPLLPRVGIVLRLAADFENIRWLGRGPWENYSDRKESADLGFWSSPVDKQYVPYVRPQENGNKEDVRWLELTDAPGNGLRISTAGNPFSFSALHFTAADLAAVRHNFELQPRPEIILSLDAKMSGLGNSSCGPGLLEPYSVRPQVYRLDLKLAPVTQVRF